MTMTSDTPVLVHTGRGIVVHTGEVVSILGAPGSGKTRLGLELAFLRRPAVGEVLLNGDNPASRKRVLEPSARPREVTMLVQNAEDQLFARTVFDDVAFGPRRLMLPEDEIEHRVLLALSSVRLDADEVRDRSPFALSGGERRRVALAGVLAMQPLVLVLDEPTANLDPRTRNEFLELLRPLRERSAIVWLTTSAREASHADRIYVLRDGTAREVRGGVELLHDWRELWPAGVELPAVFELAGALEQRGFVLPNADDPRELEQEIIDTWRRRHDDR
ncbi:MAG TPA: ATP-binding cassette domain-containing protein [Chloroflexota bacterium]